MSAVPPSLFSADSHVVEPNHCYLDYIEAKYRDHAPRYVTQAEPGDPKALLRTPAGGVLRSRLMKGR